MKSIKRNNMIAFGVGLAVLTILSAGFLSAAVTMPPPSNGGPAILAWLCGITFGLYLAMFMITVREK